MTAGTLSSGPSDEELRTFIGSLLANLDRRLREDDVIDEALRDHREMWAMLYRASMNFGDS